MYAVEYPVVRASIADAPCVAAAPSPAMARLAAAKARVPEAIRTYGRTAWKHACDAGVVAPTDARRRPVSRAYYKLREIYLTCALPLPRSSRYSQVFKTAAALPTPNATGCR